MSKANSLKNISEIYNQMLEQKVQNLKPVQSEVVEEKAAKKLNTFPVAKDTKINIKKITASGSNKDAFVHKDSGPENADGFNKNIIDPKTAKKDNHYQPQKFSSALEKTQTSNINNNMSKSIFDKLFEDVMNDDALDLGVEVGPEGEAGDKAPVADAGGEGDVTLTLPRDLAQKLHDALVGVLGGESEGEGEAEDVEVSDEVEEDENEKKHKEDEDKKEEDENEVAGEATELETLPDSKGKSLQKKGGVPTVGNVKPKGGKASGQVSTEVDGKGTPVADSKGLSLTKHGANKPAASGYAKGDFFK